MNLPANHLKTLVIVMDGFGFEPKVERQIAAELLDALPDELRARLEGLNAATAAAVLAPPGAGLLRSAAFETGDDLEVFRAKVGALRDNLRAFVGATVWEHVEALRRELAWKHRYAPWAASIPAIDRLRDRSSTYVTRTAGVFTGFDDMSPGPEVMGNSDTGHQQIFNLMVARQVPAAITAMINRGEFMDFKELNHDLVEAAGNSKVVFKTLLSGEFGDDGYVHSAWRHMEAFLELYFSRLKLPASSLQLEIVLDGRDSPGQSSLLFETMDGVERFGFLHKLLRLLDRYNARGCSGWVLGRQFLDRDYKGEMIRVEYEAVTANKGRPVKDWDAALAQVAADHAAGKMDPMVEPIVIGNPRPLGPGVLLFNGIFRADRQEPITAALLGAKAFIEKTAKAKGKLDTWDGFSWLRDLRGLRLWSMAQYHAAFSPLGCKVVFHDAPHEHNILALLAAKVPGFRFMFLTEGVKEKHMGMFSRGRRSTPFEGVETQVTVSSWGKDEGIENDNQFFKVPQMRHPEISARLMQELDRDWPLIAVNFPGADMIGHLIVEHFDAAVATLESLDRLVVPAVSKALGRGYAVIVTADHGNVDKFGPEHGNNDVLTTVLIPAEATDRFQPLRPPKDEARLFDISWTVLAFLGLTPALVQAPPFPADVLSSPDRLVGTSLVLSLTGPTIQGS